MSTARQESIKFWMFLGTLAIAVSATVLGLDWFYAGFFFGIIVGGWLFQEPLRK